MRTLLLTLVAIVLATVVTLSQGVLSVPFTSDQQKGVQFELDRVNAERAAQNPPLPPLALQPFAVQGCQANFTRFASIRREAQEVEASIRDTYLGHNSTYAFTDADRDAVNAFMAACVASGGCP